MLASFPASMVNQKSTDLGIPNRFKLKSSRFSTKNAPIPTDMMMSIAAGESLSSDAPGAPFFRGLRGGTMAMTNKTFSSSQRLSIINTVRIKLFCEIIGLSENQAEYRKYSSAWSCGTIPAD
jgi:hypothetical protein